MRVKRRVFPLIVLASLAIAGVAALAISQQVRAGAQYFSETGRLVREPFLETFEQHGGIAMFGYPLTDAYVDENGTLVQTFQSVRLQLTVRGVELAPIGRALGLDAHQADLRVAPAFEDFYTVHGGEPFFGPPLDAAHTENGRLVQDFERVRLVQEPDGRTYLADLGVAYHSAFPPPYDSGQAAIRLRGAPTPPPDVHASVSVEHPAVPQGGEQTLYLFVYDENGNPIEGARALAILRYDTSAAELELSPTDANGYASARFPAPPALPGAQVIVEVHILAGEAFLTTETTYFQWW